MIKIQHYPSSSKPRILFFSVNRLSRYRFDKRQHADAVMRIHDVDIIAGNSLLDYMTMTEDHEKTKRDIEFPLSRGHPVEEAYTGKNGFPCRYSPVS